MLTIFNFILLLFQIRMMRQNNHQNGGPNGHSNAELVSNVTSHAAPPQNDIPLATNSTHLTVPSLNHSAIIQIKDSEII